MTTTKKRKGYLIVIDGSDGSGKATQTRLLVRRLRREGYAVRTMDFPRYEGTFFGKFVHACLHGKHKDFLAVDPYIVSVLYAADRWESKIKIEKWLSQGCIVVLDRYVSANQIHQGGKISNASKRARFLAWLDEMEHSVFGVPRPDTVFYLDVPTEVSLRLLAASGKELDAAERDVTYLENSRRSATLLARRGGWVRIGCTRRGVMRSIEDIQEEIFALCKKNGL